MEQRRWNKVIREFISDLQSADSSSYLKDVWSKGIGFQVDSRDEEGEEDLARYAKLSNSREGKEGEGGRNQDQNE